MVSDVELRDFRTYRCDNACDLRPEDSRPGVMVSESVEHTRSTVWVEAVRSLGDDLEICALFGPD